MHSNLPLRKTLCGLRNASLLTLLLLLGCQAQPVIKTSLAQADQALYARTPEPVPEVPFTNAAHGRLTQAYQSALESCNIDKDAIGVWFENLLKGK